MQNSQVKCSKIFQIVDLSVFLIPFKWFKNHVENENKNEMEMEHQAVQDRANFARAGKDLHRTCTNNQ